MKEQNSKTDNELLREISRKLTELTAIIGLSGRSKDDQISYLANFELTNVEISKLTGFPEGTVGRIRAEKSKQKKIKK
jgi:hypothetical protein